MHAGADSRGGKSRSKPYGTPNRDYVEKALTYFIILVLLYFIYIGCYLFIFNFFAVKIYNTCHCFAINISSCVIL